MLAHFIEDEGIATTAISLVREHTERIRPPRALWVPFELGRPLGAPDAPDFQREVLRAALALLERPAGPVIEDYPHEAPLASATADGWACPVALPAPELGEGDAERVVQRLLDEVARLRPWHDEASRARGRTTIGVSGLGADGMAAAAAVLARYAAGERPTAPRGAAHDFPPLLRFLADDLKAYYFEAAGAQPGRAAGADELGRWLFGETQLGDVLFRLRAEVRASDDAAERRLQGALVPQAFRSLRARSE